MDKVYNVVIIGAGAIGAGYDAPGSPYFLTHAHAFSAHDGFNLVGFVDHNSAVAADAARKWETSSFSSFNEAYLKVKIDVVCVAVPDQYHFNVLKELSSYDNLFILTEKPLTENLEEAREIISIFKKRGINASINFKRSFLPEIIAIKNRIHDNEFGDITYAQGFYNKGFKHNGSHLINLFINLTGLISLRLNSYNGEIDDFTSEDPSISVTLSGPKDFEFVIKAFHESHYPIFELDFHFEKGRIRVLDAGRTIEVYKVIINKAFGSSRLLQMVESIETSIDRSMYITAENVYLSIHNNETLLSPIEDGLQVIQFIDSILKEIKLKKCQN